MGNGKWEMENIKRRKGNGKWGMGNGKWEMGNGKWEMRNGERQYDSSYFKFKTETYRNGRRV